MSALRPAGDAARAPRPSGRAKAALSGAALLPRNAGVLLLRGYRAVVSPLYGQVCRYYPSCSAYALEAVQLHGLLRGGLLAAWRVLRCNPWSRGGIDDVPEPRRGRPAMTRFGFVLPHGAGHESCHDHGREAEGTALRHA